MVMSSIPSLGGKIVVVDAGGCRRTSVLGAVGASFLTNGGPAMPFEATILFTGLCSFVPSDDSKRMRAVLVNARPGGVIDDDFANAHTPLIEFDIFNLDKNMDSLPRPAFEVFDNKRGFWFLNHDNIKLITDGVDLLSFNPTEITKAKPDNDQEAKWLFWTPSMKKVSGGSGKMRRDFVKGDSISVRKHVIARMDFANGLLLPDRFTKTARYIPWHFRAKGGSTNKHTQTLAEAVMLYLGENVKRLELEIAGFDGANPRRLTFKADNKSSMQIWVRNLELEQVTNPYEAGYPEIVEDFKYFYSLIEDGDSNLPHLKERVLPQRRKALGDVREYGPRAVTRPICPSAIFSSSPDV